MHNDTTWQPDISGWRQRYEESGYLLVENVVDGGTLDRLRAGLERIERQVAEGSLPENLRRWISLERDRTRSLRAGQVDTGTISNIMELPLFDAVFADFITYPRVLDILEALFGTAEFSFHNYKAICKMPGGQAPFQWHRDLPFLRHTTPNLITCMLCVDPMTAENGATVVCPGSHRIPYDMVQDSDRDMAEEEVPAGRVTVTCPAGSAVLFHVNLVHGGGPNLSQA
ncbi:MAG: phytanoyl-CoA dioxygenase family protein, partial [Chloroflexi bacterium]|nr:phytanoyl-CoA dioxygenase family protein [Chloroflexota bacterium]